MKLILSDPDFEYDIRGLLMSFYPRTKFVTDDTEEDTEALYVTYADGKAELKLLTDGREFTDTVLMPDDRTGRKNELKRALYRLLSGAKKTSLPWGTLSGIRPTKIPMAGLAAGESDEEILKHLKEDLYVSDEKAKLSLEIAGRELSLIRKVDTEKGYSLYVGIPFCPTTCAYCSFTSYPLKKYKSRVWEYLHALKKELKYVSEAFEGRTLDTVYFGGGTPTTLEPDQLDYLLGHITEYFDLSKTLEWTVEGGRPDSITEEKLKVLRKYPVTRLSVNPQTMHQETLDAIGRRHTVEDVYRAFQMARDAGFDNINMDLIVGLAKEGQDDIRDTLEKVIALDPENVTIHSLAVKRAARLSTEAESYRDFMMDNSDEIMRMCREMLKNAGLDPYYLYRQKNMAGNQENVGFAKPGTEGVYNILIMEEVESILACGAGASTKRVNGSLITRAENVKNVELYMQNIDEMIERKRQLFL